MACTYTFNIPVDLDALVPMLRREVEQSGGSVTGELPHLAVIVPTKVGEIRGTCSVVGKTTVTVVVTKKPDIVTCNSVREKLVFYLTEAVKHHAHQAKAGKQQEGRPAK